MLSENYDVFKKNNLDFYLKELAKEYRKAVGKNIHAEVILVGGAAILANYGFRDMTTDIDAVIVASSAMKDAINRIGDRYGLPNGWLNMDFQKTFSYSAGLLQHSLYYKCFSQVLDVRVVTAEYLIAMKKDWRSDHVCSYRYSRDRSVWNVGGFPGRRKRLY